MNNNKSSSITQARILFNQGLSLQSKNEYNEALKKYEQVVEMEPRILPAWYNMGSIYQKLGNYHKAIDLYKIAVRINPDFSKGWYCMAVAYFKIGDRRMAMSAYEKAKQLDPKLTTEYVNDFQFSFLRLPEESHTFEERILSSYQFIDGTTEGELPKFCTACGNTKWKKISEESIIKAYCISCGYEIIIGRIQRSREPSVTADHWSGLQDDIERILEKEYEKGKR